MIQAKAWNPNPRKFWQVVNNVLGKNTRGEGIIEVNGVPLSKVDTAQLFAEFFQKKVAKLSNTAIQPCRLPNPNIPIILKKEEVFDALNKMKLRTRWDTSIHHQNPC